MSITTEQKKILETKLAELKNDAEMCGEVVSCAVRASTDDLEIDLLLQQWEALQNMISEIETELNNEPVADA